MSKYVIISEIHAVVEADNEEEAIEMYYWGDEILKEEQVKSAEPLSESESPIRDLICE